MIRFIWDAAVGCVVSFYFVCFLVLDNCSLRFVLDGQALNVISSIN